jgi:enediyne biosynthesis protein E4
MRKIFILLALGLASCNLDQRKADALFEQLPAEQTHLDFVNTLHDDKSFNIFNYRNFYNGGGVAIGDVNNDGLPDVFVTSNFDDNKLYLNKGNFEFEDISEKAGIKGKHAWSTGVTFADLNGDGWLDIYVCNSGNRKYTDGSQDDRSNELYISNGATGGIPTFSEKAQSYGLDDKGFGTHAAFFDYDRDGDLDMYLLNNSFTPIGRLGYENLRKYRDPLGGDKLFRNDGARFTDVSEKAGIYGSLIGFGLGITIGDVNNDNWLDIYISNDFHERDYLYINQQDGTFKETIKEQMPHISLSSMGADVADINNDGNLDIFVTDMLPGDDRRLKTTSVYEGYELTEFKYKQDYWHQLMRNNLQLNNGDGTFSEIGCLAGVQATDWSWGALIFDMDNDGRKDIFVANGIAKDLTDQDFVNFLGAEENIRQALETRTVDVQGLISKISSKPIPNYAFRNEGGLQFKNVTADWGLDEPSFSNGSAYGDLDNDGDLDLIVNNVNAPLGVFRNRSVEKNKTHFLKVSLQGTALNRNGIGAKVYVYQGGQMQYLQQMPNRGFQSSSDHHLVFGLGNNPKIDSLLVIWPDDRQQRIVSPKADTPLQLTHANAKDTWRAAPALSTKYLTDLSTPTQLNYKHEENGFVDYNRDGLLKQKYSTSSPVLAVGDINGDGLDDVYLGGANGQAKVLLLQQPNGTFKENKQAAFEADIATETAAAVFFDADKDQDLDLYVATGSNEFSADDPALKDLLYLNDGKGNFKKDTRLPNLYDSGGCVAAADFDRDGDQDLFVGSRLVPGQYGLGPTHYLLVNDGTGNFKNLTSRYLPQIKELGMLTDALWADVNGDQNPDLVVAQDWGEIVVFSNTPNHTFTATPVPQTAGWWNRLHTADVDADGDLDLVAGNLGYNSRLKVSEQQPAQLYTNDFDRNGSVEQVITCFAEDGRSYPMVLKTDLQKQLPSIKTRFVKFADYAGKAIQDVFTSEQLTDATVRKATQAATSLLINDGKGQFTLQALPVEAQFAPVHGIETLDVNADGKLDIVLAGNFFDCLPEIGRYDASYGLVLTGNGKGGYKPMKAAESGFMVKGQVRSLRKLKTLNQKSLLFCAKNNDNAQVFGLK